MPDDSGLMNVGIVGTGFAAESHVEALRRLSGLRVAAIASRSERRAVEAARRLGIERAFRDAGELIADPSIDAVHICTINRLHAKLTALALRAGKHVLTEKPLATNSHETKQLAELAAEAGARGTVAAVCFNYRHYALIQHMRAIVASGVHGPVHFVHGSYLQDWLLYDTDWNWRVDTNDSGASRAVADIGSHWIDLVQHVSGERVTEVFADLATHHAVRLRPLAPGASFQSADAEGREPVPVHNEDFGTVMIRFASGARGAFAISQVSPGRKNRLTFQIDTADAGFAWDQEQPDIGWVGRRGMPNLQYLRDPGASSGLTELPAGHPEGWRDTLRNLFADFYAAAGAGCENGGPSGAFATFAEAHRTTQLVEAIVESHREGSWVQIPDHDKAAA